MIKTPVFRGYETVGKDGVTVSFSWCHSRRKTIGITIRPDTSVSVRAPFRTSVADMRAFVIRHIDWIVKSREKLDSRVSRVAQAYTDGSLLLFQGQECRLMTEEGKEDGVRLANGTLTVTAREHSETRTVQIIDSWYRERAAELFNARAIECHRLMRDEHIPLPQLIIRRMKSRWGSYSYRTGRVCLNLNLVMVEQACLDYVIVHELCHIKVRHHGPEFWAVVGRYVPDYPELRRQLRMFA